MTEQTQTPLVSPMRRHGWQEIVRLRPLSNTPHVALVVTRQGRLANVIPADDRRVLSDYVTWPYDFREVDMRERLLVVRQRLASCDVGYEFDATLKLTYQVARPERVALELEDALTELEQALLQSMRVTSRSFGVEQAKALEENLGEALLYGDVLRQRLEALGLALCRADVVIELDDHARARAQALRDHMRERPLLARLTIESLTPESSFDVLVGGSYRLTSRAVTNAPSEALDSSVHEAIIRTLRGIGIAYAPQDYLAAAQAMAEALRHDMLLQTELSAAAIELIRPMIKIQPDRQMVVAAAQAAPPALPAPAPESARQARRGLPLLADHESASEPDDAPPWASLGAAFGREGPAFALPPATPHLLTDRAEIQPAQDSHPDAEIVESPSHPAVADRQRFDQFAAQAAEADAAPEIASFQQPAEDLSAMTAPPALDDARDAGDHSMPMWASLGAASGREESVRPEHQAPPEPEQVPVAPPQVNSYDLFAPPAGSDVSHEQIERWVALFEADGPALFKLRTMEMIEQPELLSMILPSLTNDPAALTSADDPRYQQALVQALESRRRLGTPAAHTPQPAALAQPAAPSERTEEQEEPPDWLQLRRSGKDDGGGA